MGYWWQTGNPSDLTKTVKALIDTRKDIINTWQRAEKHYFSVQALPGVLRENVAKQAIDALTAKIGSDSPRPIVVTTDGSFEAVKQASAQTLALEAIMHNARVYSQARLIFRDACIFGTSAAKVFLDLPRRDIGIVRVRPYELLLDNVEARDDQPQQVIHARVCSKIELSRIYRKKEQQAVIAKSRLSDPHSLACYANVSEPVTVYDAYYAASADGEKDGYHLICTSAGVLAEEPWHSIRLPFAFYRWKRPTEGFWGRSAYEDVAELQNYLDTLDERIAQMLAACATRFFVDRSTKVTIEDLNPDTTDGYPVVLYNGTPPQAIPDPGPPAALLQERANIKQAIFNALGISQLFALALKPAGLSSGEALRAYRDTENERFRDIMQDWEQFFIDLAVRILDMMEPLRAAVGDREYMLPRAEGLKTVTLSQLQLHRQKYIVQIRATALLPREPAGRLQTIQELASMFPAAAQLLATKLDNPDVDGVMKILAAPVMAVMADIEQLNEGKQVSPEPYIPHDAAKALVLSNYLAARNNGASDEVLEAYRSYLQELVTAEQIATQAAAQQSQLPQLTAALPQGGENG
jgi:hypothetical protein